MCSGLIEDENALLEQIVTDVKYASLNREAFNRKGEEIYIPNGVAIAA